MIKALKTMPYAQARVHTHPACIWLQSYDTCVAVLENDWLTINGLYSMTTRRHLTAFCKEYCGGIPFATIKMLATQHLILNIRTGEIENATR